MNTKLLNAASTMSGLTFLAHIFIGGPKNATPIFSIENLPNDPKWTVYFSWHSASVLLLFMALGYAWAAYSGEGKSLVVFLTALSATLCVVAGITAYFGGIQIWNFPPSMLFAVITVLGGLAVVK